MGGVNDISSGLGAALWDMSTSQSGGAAATGRPGQAGPAAASNSLEAWSPAGVQAPAAPAGFDLGGMLAGLFGGGGQTKAQQANLFDLGALLGQVFNVASSLFGGGQAASAPRPILTSSNGTNEQPSVHVQGSTAAGPVRLSGAADAEAHARTRATGSVSAGPDGVTVSGAAEAALGVSASASGTVETDLGSISGHAGVSAELYARARGYVRAHTAGAEAGGTVETGALAKANADARARLLGGLVKGEAHGRAESGTGATATADVALSYSPLEGAFTGSAGAFAGARAGFTSKGGVAGASYTATAEAWAGVGAKAELDCGLKDGKFKFEFGLGLGVGVGAFLKCGFELDLKDVGSAASSIAGAAASVVGGVVGGVANAVGDVFGGLFGAIGGLFGGGKGDGKHAGNVVDAFLADKAAAVIGSLGSFFGGTPALAGAGGPTTTSQQAWGDAAFAGTASRFGQSLASQFTPDLPRSASGRASDEEQEEE